MTSLSGINTLSVRFIETVKAQRKQVRDRGFQAILRIIVILSGLVLAFVPLLLVRIIRPVITVRFGRFDHSIGGFAAIPDIYLCEQAVGMHGGRVIDLFCHRMGGSNQQLKKMWGRRFHVYPFVASLLRLNELIPGGKAHKVPWHPEEDTHRLIKSTPSHVYFTKDEEHRGAIELQGLGVAPKTPFICFHARDTAYMASVYPGVDLAYHDYRDSSIQNHLPAVEKLAERGLYSLRMGAVVKDPISSDNPRVIDYATIGHTDFLDVYLAAKCKFFVASDTGLHALPLLFRRPIVLVNMVRLDGNLTWFPNQVMIPKKIWSLDEERYLTVSEMLRVDYEILQEVEHLQVGYQLIKRRLEMIENTPDEIFDAVSEMDDRLNGTWKNTKEDDLLQDRFWALFDKEPLKADREYLSRIGAKYLRQNQDLLN